MNKWKKLSKPVRPETHESYARLREPAYLLYKSTFHCLQVF